MSERRREDGGVSTFSNPINDALQGISDALLERRKAKIAKREQFIRDNKIGRGTTVSYQGHEWKIRDFWFDQTLWLVRSIGDEVIDRTDVDPLKVKVII